jgi:hypothetical protein
MTEHAETADRRDLPLPDYDHLDTGALSAAISSLDTEGVEELLAYERAHGDRLPVVQLLEHRIEQLHGGRQPSDPPASDGAVRPAAPGQGSAVSPSTQGPPVNPPSQGDPTNPAQPRG